MNKIISDKINIILYFVLSVFSVIPFFSNGFFQIHDDVQVARVFEMGKSILSGALPVRWVADLGYGLGYPIFNFYSVLPYYLGGLVNILGFDALVSTKIIFVIGILLAGISMYFLTENFFGKIPGLVASIVYLYFPYHAVNIYVRGDLAEIFAYAFLPIVFLSFFKIFSIEKKTISKKYITLASLSISAVVLSHNLSAFMLALFLGIFILFSLIFGKNKKNLIISYCLIFLLSFLLSAFYVVPAVSEVKFTNIASQLVGGSDFSQNFVCISQLWDSPWGFGGSAPGCIDGLSFRLGKSNIAFVVLALILLFLSFKKLKERKVITLMSFCFLFFSIFMMQASSKILWQAPFMNFLQFPWRFLNFAGVFTSFLIGFLVWSFGERYHKNLGIILAVLVIFSTLLFNTKLFVPQRNLNRNVSYYTNSEYLTWTASKISDEYLPKNFVKPNDPTQKLQFDPSLRSESNGFFTEVPGGLRSVKFKSSQTIIEIISDMLSTVGVIAMILVIISKSNIFYGKKTS